jgi:tRNA(Ile)-lysidine synthase
VNRFSQPSAAPGSKIIAEVKKTVAAHGMLNGVNRVLIAFSAGPDSVCLLDILDRLYRDRIQFRLAYVNHGLRSDRILKREERLTRQYASRYGRDCDLIRIKVGKSKLGPEGQARTVRYHALRETMKRTGCQRIALAHNLDDFVETFLMNLIRGSGPRGFQSIPAVRRPFIRPLIHVKKKDVMNYLKARHLRFSVDASNWDLKYRRNLVRHKVIPRLLAVNPRLHEAVKRAADIMKADDDYLESCAERIYDRTVRDSDNNLSLDMAKLIRYNKALSYRVVRKAVYEMAGTLEGFESKHFALIFGLMSKENGKIVNLPKGLFVQKDYHRVRLGKKRKVESFYRKMNMNDETVVRGPRIVRTRLTRHFNLCERKPDTEVFDRKQIFPPLYIRSKRPGDYIETKVGKKKMKKFYNEYKIPAADRDRLLVLGDRKGILWLLGYTRAHRGWIGKGTKKFLVVNLEKIN